MTKPAKELTGLQQDIVCVLELLLGLVKRGKYGRGDAFEVQRFVESLRTLEEKTWDFETAIQAVERKAQEKVEKIRLLKGVKS
jgi:hypothetical protein